MRVVGEQYAWNVHYPGPRRPLRPHRPAFITAADPLGIDRSDAAGRDDFVLINLLVLPEGRPAVVHLAAKDVIHSFTLAEMRVKQDVTPGPADHDVVHADGDGHLGDRLLAVVRPGPLPDARRVRGAHEAAWRAFVADEVALVATTP